MGLSKLLFAGRFLQRGGLQTVGSRVLSTSKSRAKEQCDGTTQANEWSAVTTMMTGDDGESKKQDGIKKHALVVAYAHNDVYKLSDNGVKMDKDAGGKLAQELNKMQQYMDVGKAFVVADVGKYAAVAIAGCGAAHKNHIKEDLDLNKENTRLGVGAGVKALLERGARVIELDSGVAGLGIHEASTEAALLAAWQFDRKDNQPEIQLENLFDACRCHDWRSGLRRGRAQNWARYLSDMPANEMTPRLLAEAVLNKLCPKVKVVAHDRAWIEAQGMEAFLAVARGSCEEPVFLECEWKPNDGPTVLVAAKGVTFDCGGICLKEHQQMKENRGSMAGAAAALGAMWAITQADKQKEQLDLNVTMVIPLCENMISGQCMKVGDVVNINGLNIKIEDTDMEGRLMLADALVYGQAAHKPEVVIDVATLTHGIRHATGGGAFGAFTNDDKLWDALREAGQSSGDRPWRFPLWEYYHRRIVDDPSFDLRNRGPEHASPCVGAAFLKNFVCERWIHMDTTGVAKLAHDDPPYLSRRRMSGRPTRTLIGLLELLAKELKKKETPK